MWLSMFQDRRGLTVYRAKQELDASLITSYLTAGSSSMKRCSGAAWMASPVAGLGAPRGA